MTRKIPTYISYLFHPVILPLITVLLYFYINQDYFTRLEISIILTQVLIVTFFIPVCFYYLLKSLKIIQSSMMVNNLKERVIPFAINIILLFILKSFILYNNSAYELKIYFYGLISTYLILLILACFRHKSSVHIAMLTGCLGFYTVLVLYNQIPDIITIILLVLITGITASSQLYLHAHSSAEVVSGGIAGLLPQVILFWLAISHNI